MATKLGKIVADFSTTLATAISISGTTLTLQSIVDDDGNNIPDGVYYFTIDGNNSSKEHIRCTIVGASVSSIVSVSRQGVETSGVARAHRVGAQVVITDFAHILRFSELFQGTTRLDATTPLRYDGTATISNANDLATKAYVDGVAIAGGADASTTVKGITKMSVAPASAASPIAVGDNDPRVSPVSLASLTTDIVAALAGSGTPSASNKFVTADTDALKELLSNKSTDVAFGGATPSDTKYSSQKAGKQGIFISNFITTQFETAGRFSSTVTNGTNTFNTNGLNQDTTTNSTSYAKIGWVVNVGSSNDITAGSPAFNANFNVSAIGTSGSSFCGIGAPTVSGTGHTYTVRHAGFKILFTAGPVATLYATQADGTTESASSALTTLTANDQVEVALIFNGTASVDYYYRKNGAAWSAATNITTNMPNSSTNQTVQFSVSNNSTTQQNTIIYQSAGYKR